MKFSLLFSAFMSVTACCNAQDSFTWVTWDKVSSKTKAELKLIKIDRKTSLYDAVMNHKKEGVADADLSIAVLDMDKDGKPEYALSLMAMEYCGSLGCSLEVYKDGGSKQIHLTDEIESVKPRKNGVLSSQGKLIPFENVKVN